MIHRDSLENRDFRVISSRSGFSRVLSSSCRLIQTRLSHLRAFRSSRRSRESVESKKIISIDQYHDTLDSKSTSEEITGRIDPE
jgi:hypothetical protein